jgi:hypothetical protein
VHFLLKIEEARRDERAADHQRSVRAIGNCQPAAVAMVFGDDQEHGADRSNQVERLPLQVPGQRLQDDPPGKEWNVQSDSRGRFAAVGPH